MNIQEVEVEKIRPYERNAKTHTGRQVEQIANSIRQFGFRQPIVLDKNGVIIIGHGRYQAAMQLKMKTVPCVRAEDLTEEQVAALRLADNKLNESDWEMDNLEKELAEIQDIDMAEFGLDLNDEWFQREEKDGKARQEGNEEYNDFLEKFETKKTTDDCYTPENVYDVVASWVAKEFGLNRKNFMRPFYPGGDYQNEKYGEGKIVVDNPPFSILAQILKWYEDHGVKFFLFAPALTVITATKCDLTYIVIGGGITYENGAEVSTAFITNLDNENRFRIEPELYQLIKEKNDENTKKVELPNYAYPDNVLVPGQVQKLAKHGQTLRIKKTDCVVISELDEQKAEGKAIYGKGLLLSEKAATEKVAAEKAATEKAAAEKVAQEKAAAEKAAARVWKLSDRELKIVKKLGKQK